MGVPIVKFFDEDDESKTVLLKLRSLDHALHLGHFVTYTSSAGGTKEWKVESVKLEISTNPGGSAEQLDYHDAPVLWIGVKEI